MCEGGGRVEEGLCLSPKTVVERFPPFPSRTPKTVHTETVCLFVKVGTCVSFGGPPRSSRVKCGRDASLKVPEFGRKVHKSRTGVWKRERWK